jgi:hypothetical protein
MPDASAYRKSHGRVKFPVLAQAIVEAPLTGFPQAAPGRPVCGKRRTATSQTPTRRASCLLEALQTRKGVGNGAALRWQVAILKILAAQTDGEAPVSVVIRDLSLLVTSRLPASVSNAARGSPCTIFADALIERPAKGRWRISKAGREYLRSLEANSFREAAE